MTTVLELPMTTIALLTLALLALLGCGWLAWHSYREAERRAVRVALALGALSALALGLAVLLPATLQLALLGFIALLALTAAVLLLLPMGHVEVGRDRPQRRYDERDIPFARARLEPGSAEHQAYYRMRPENLAPDEEIRRLPGLLSPSAAKAHRLAFAAAEASFALTEALADEVDGPVAPDALELPAGQATPFVKALTRYYGALEAGITRLEPYHLYSHVGRGSGVYGAPVALDHRWAIAFTVEMGAEMVAAGPAAPTVMESAKQYVEAARVAVQLATFIRSLGYPARAHIDGNYRVVAPLVARDAGLGEIGRMGILMTPRLGPRVRLGVVTTDLPLIPDRRQPDRSMLDFCRICRKCAENCPSRAIPLSDRQEIDGALRWRIDAQRCFRYWNQVGTDCGRCMAVCPYSHPPTPPHNLVRWAMRRSGAARRLALYADALLYGRHPRPLRGPRWIAEAKSLQQRS